MKKDLSRGKGKNKNKNTNDDQHNPSDENLSILKLEFILVSLSI